MSAAIRPAYASITFISRSRCAGVIADTVMPAGASGLMSSLLPVTISFGAVALMIAVVRCVASSAVTSARAASSSCGQHTLPFCGAVPHFGGIRSGERRRAGDRRAVDHGEMQRDVMALDAPSPGAGRRRRRRRPRSGTPRDRARIAAVSR